MRPVTASKIAGLIGQAREGDEQALDRLLESYRAYIVLLARIQIGRRLRGKASESDVAQETMFKARNSFAQFRGSCDAELMAWLRRILANQLTDFVRHYHAGIRDVRLEASLDEELSNTSANLPMQLCSRGPSPSDDADRRELAVVLAEALAALPSAYREVVILRHIEQLTFPQIAQRMGRSLDSTKNMWVRAMAKLREQLEPFA